MRDVNVARTAAPLRMRTLFRTIRVEDVLMKILTASDARANLYRLLDEAADSHEPIRITGRRNNAVLVSEEDWNAVQETLYLVSIPGMRDSIREGLDTPLSETSVEPGW